MSINFIDIYYFFPRNTVSGFKTCFTSISRGQISHSFNRESSECDVMFDKFRRQTLAVALFNLCYVFYIVFDKRIKWCIVPHIIAEMGLPVDGVCIHSHKTRLVCAIGCET